MDQKVNQRQNTVCLEQQIYASPENFTPTLLVTLETFRRSVDECIKDMVCEGNCLHVGCSMTQLQRLNFMKNQGGRRNSPAESITNSKLFYCPQCNFKSNQEKEIENHVQREHDTCTSCPFCLVGFQNQIALQRHVENNHKENSGIIRERQQSFRERRISIKKGPCIFFIQPRGCKKGQECDFSHDLGAQYTSVKVRKVCYNGPSCNWKPRCRYVHLEDGEIIPPIVPTRSQPRQETREQGFGPPDLSQAPPGFSMRSFPPLAQPERQSVFRMNPQYSQ